jgi:Putative auto-transporter adhesin, head GIN domain
MKKMTFLAVIIFTISSICTAQRGPLNGSGKIIIKTFSYINFDKLELNDLNGKVEVTIGKPFSINIAIDDNLEDLLAVTESNGTLTLELKGNRNNKMYIENTSISIQISMPQVSVLNHNGNSSLTVNGIMGRYLRLKNNDNGSTKLNGSIDELEITCHGNGNVYAAGLFAKTINVNKSGNGNVVINTDYPFNANGSGNGDIINKGKGRAAEGSHISGNGEIIYAAIKEIMMQQNKKEKSEGINVTIKNFSHSSVKLSVKYPVKGSYGMDVKSQDILMEPFPVGTKIYRGNQFTVFKKPVYVVTDDGGGQSIIIQH